MCVSNRPWQYVELQRLEVLQQGSQRTVIRYSGGSSAPQWAPCFAFTGLISPFSGVGALHAIIHAMLLDCNEAMSCIQQSHQVQACHLDQLAALLSVAFSLSTLRAALLLHRCLIIAGLSAPRSTRARSPRRLPPSSFSPQPGIQSTLSQQASNKADLADKW